MKAKCQNCEWAGEADDVGGVYGIERLLERVEPGEPMPACECPECEALCQPVEGEG